MKRLAFLATLWCLAAPSTASIGVRIVDYPSTVLQYSPVIVTARVENSGSEPVLIPASDRTDSHYFVEIGRSPETLAELRPLDATGAKGTVVWLKPGESWLFQFEIGPSVHEPGPHTIRVGLTSSGECRFRATGKEGFPLTVVEKRPGNESYACWAGKALSDVMTIEVIEPSAAVDREALEFIRSGAFPVDCCLADRFHLRLQFGERALRERFPTSHYTFVAGFYAGQKAPEHLDHLVDEFSGHPLVPYARFTAALSRLRGKGGSMSAEQIGGLDLPATLKDYLVQENRRGLETGCAKSR